MHRQMRAVSLPKLLSFGMLSWELGKRHPSLGTGRGQGDMRGVMGRYKTHPTSSHCPQPWVQN